MQKSIGIIALLVCLCGCDINKGLTDSESWNKTTEAIDCRNGYAFLFAGRGVTQLFENTENGVRAIECPRMEATK